VVPILFIGIAVIGRNYPSSIESTTYARSVLIFNSQHFNRTLSTSSKHCQLGSLTESEHYDVLRAMCTQAQYLCQSTARTTRTQYSSNTYISSLVGNHRGKT